VLSLAAQTGMEHHKWSHLAAVALRLNNESLSTVLIAESLRCMYDRHPGTGGGAGGRDRYMDGLNGAYVVATETMRCKRAFLSYPVATAHFQLDKFGNLREVSLKV